jgi:hypothetical protein
VCVTDLCVPLPLQFQWVNVPDQVLVVDDTELLAAHVNHHRRLVLTERDRWMKEGMSKGRWIMVIDNMGRIVSLPMLSITWVGK